MSKSKKIEYRDIDTPASGTWKERVEARVNAALIHPLMTGSHLRWEQEHFDHDVSGRPTPAHRSNNLVTPRHVRHEPA